MVKEYTWLRVNKESAKILKERLEKINKEDLNRIGVRNKKIPQIEFTNFLFRTPIYIGNNELKKMVKNKIKTRKC
jgi:hypothetical protein